MRSIDKVMLVDDEGDIRVIAKLSLEKVGGWQFVAAASGYEALEKLRVDRPDVILLDVMMPELDGPSTFAALRELPEAQDIPVIFLTAKVQRKEVQRYLELGALGVIPKPFDPMTLPQEIRRIVDAAK